MTAKAHIDHRFDREPPLPGLEETPEEVSRRASLAREEETATRIASWFTEDTERLVKGLVPKAVEYSSYDLVLLGRVLLGLLDHPDQDDDGTCAEAGCLLYALGKTARAIGAYKDGARPGPDSVLDLQVYAAMARYTREHGQWP